jgi:superfamily II DNA or RNA helicase
MKEELLLSLSTILEGDIPIKFRVDEIYAVRKQLDEYLTDEERLYVTNKIRAKIQKEAEQFWKEHGSRGAVLMATGTGKSKIGVDIIVDDYNEAPNYSLIYDLIVVPTEKLRDEGWKDEFNKWGAGDRWRHVEKTCYASLHKIKGRHFNVVILDEGHNLTKLNSRFFKDNKVDRVLWLSATKPRDKEKIQILKELKINPVYEITLDEAVKLGLTPPYDITIVTTKLDTKNKYLKSGSKIKGYFFQTEAQKYQWYNTRCIAAPNKQNFIDRMRFIYNLKSKSEAAKWLLENVIPEEKRTLIFAGSKKEAILLCNNRFFSRPSKPKPLKGNESESKKEQYNSKLVEYQIMMTHYQGDESYNAFKEKSIQRLSCIEALNEGENLNDLDICFLVQLNSNELNLWQRMGRIRFKPGLIAKIIILCCEDTQDKEWTETATLNLDAGNIRWISLDDLKSGKETIKF